MQADGRRIRPPQQLLRIPASRVTAKGGIGGAWNRRLSGFSSNFVLPPVASIAACTGSGVTGPLDGDGEMVRFCHTALLIESRPGWGIPRIREQRDQRNVGTLQSAQSRRRSARAEIAANLPPRAGNCDFPAETKPLCGAPASRGRIPHCAIDQRALQRVELGRHGSNLSQERVG